jgi:hypothetical protein
LIYVVAGVAQAVTKPRKVMDTPGFCQAKEAVWFYHE